LKGNGDWQFIASEGMIFVANETILSLVFDSLEERLAGCCMGVVVGGIEDCCVKSVMLHGLSRLDGHTQRGVVDLA
jgi:hypothetical protein